MQAGWALYLRRRAQCRSHHVCCAPRWDRVQQLQHTPHRWQPRLLTQHLEQLAGGGLELLTQLRDLAQGRREGAKMRMGGSWRTAGGPLGGELLAQLCHLATKRAGAHTATKKAHLRIGLGYRHARTQLQLLYVHTVPVSGSLAARARW